MSSPTSARLAIFAILCTSIDAFTNLGTSHSSSISSFLQPQQSTHLQFVSDTTTTSSIQSKSALFMSSRGSTSRNFYEVLGVQKSSTQGEIKKAYRQLARTYHPDANPDGDKEESNKKFQEINRAYQILSDEDLRKRYDMYGEAGVGTSAASQERGGRGGNPFGGGGGGFQQDVDLGNIFDSFFGGGGMGGGGGGMGGGRRQQQRGPVAGDDLRFDLEIDFKTAIFGGEEKVRIRHLEKCSTCTGDGVKPGSKVNTCNVCRGMGVTMEVTATPLGNFQTQQTCSSCRGSGQKVDEYCGTCSGKGQNSKTKQIKVTIPPGVENGNKLRVRAEGDAGPNGGPAGDLYIFLTVKTSKEFRREGPEIYSDANISYLDALLGASIKTPVVDGEVTIKVPPGTQPGQVMRLRNNGAPRLGNADSRGDHYVTMNVEIPKKLSKEETDLIQQLKELSEKKNKKRRN